LGGRLFNLAYRIIGSREDAEDAVQEAFLQAHRSAAGFRGDSSPETWLYRITVNASLRKKQRITARSVETLLENADGLAYEVPEEVRRWGETPEERFLHDELILSIRDACLRFMAFRLTPEQRAVWILRTAFDFSYEEISKTLEISLDTVKVRLSRARANLKRFLQTDCQWLAEAGSCSCDKRIGVAYAMDPEIVRRVKQAVHSGAPTHGPDVTGRFADIDRLYEAVRAAEYDPVRLKAVIRGFSPRF
jgi:RNA polymerase sigma-70 factor (ECF subfamily)